MFSWARKLMKNEGIEENYKTAFHNLNLGLYVSIEKLFRRRFLED